MGIRACAVFYESDSSRAVADTKWSSEPLIKVVSYYKRTNLRPILSKSIFPYYDFLSLEAPQQARLCTCALGPASWGASRLEKS